MSLPKLFRRIFANEGAGPLVRSDILPIATASNRGAVPEGGQAGQVYGVDANGVYGFMGGSLSGLISPFFGSLGGPNEKHPIDRKTGQPDLSYALCDGGTYSTPEGDSVTTPDLRNLFIIGAGAAYAAGTVGGATSTATASAGGHAHALAATGATTLTVAQLPWHQHAIYGADDYGGIAAGTAIYVPDKNVRIASHYKRTDLTGATTATGSSGSHSHANSNTQNAGAHTHAVNTLPPYYALAYLMKL